MMARGEDMGEPMKGAVEVLLTWPQGHGPHGSVRGGTEHHIASYDIDAMMIEVDLLSSWFWPLQKKSAPGDEVKTEFSAIWQTLLTSIGTHKPVWTLRDYHSPNLLWLPERKGLRRVGIIDTQDCVMGHPAYDLVSMLQDARVDIDFKRAESSSNIIGAALGQGLFVAHEFSRIFAIPFSAPQNIRFLRAFRATVSPSISPYSRVSHYLRQSAHPDLAVLELV